MAKKRKSAAVAVAPKEPEPAQIEQPEPVPEPEPKTEPKTEPEQSEPGDTQQVPVEDPGVGDEEEEKAEVEEEEEKKDSDNMVEHEDDAVLADQQSKFTGNPSETAASENGGEDEGDEEEEPLEKLLEPFTKDQLTLLVKEAIAKHPDLIKIAHKLADSDPSHRKIFVHGLGGEATDDSLSSSFGKYGEIEYCTVVKDKVTGKSKGYAFILFKHRRGARQALKEPQKMVEGRMASCQLASAGPVRASTTTVAAAFPMSNESELTRRKIYISNVAADIDPDKLTDFFSSFGEIEEGPLGLDKQTGKPRGFCLYVYKNLAGAQKALEEPHKTFEGHTLHCQKAVDGPKQSKGFFNQQQPSQQTRHHGGNQGNYRHAAKKGRYHSGGNEGARPTGGHMMAPSAGHGGYNQAVAAADIGKAVAALLANQGASLGIGNLLGGLGGGVNPQGVPQWNNAAHGGQVSGYVGQHGMQGGYGVQPQMGQGGVWPHQGGAPYMGGPSH